MILPEILEKIGNTKLIAVSKLQSADQIRNLYQQGQRRFGENYIQEALKKMSELEGLEDIEWHLIGHLQKNKVKNVLGKFHIIHSVDSLDLLNLISNKCAEKSITQKVLLQVNLASEKTKEGFEISELKLQWNNIQKTPHVKILGFMTMPPLSETGEEVRKYFSQLRNLRDEFSEKTDTLIHPLTELSMGTSHDFAVAIEEGATMIRLGTILFGERPTKR